MGLARTLLSDPEIMFLDEPTSGLDPVAAREVHDLINGLRQRGVTIFLTTHRLDEAEKLCDRVAILNTTLRTVGRPAELREQLFKSALVVKTLAPLSDPEQLFCWHRRRRELALRRSGVLCALGVRSESRRTRGDTCARRRRRRCPLHQRGAAFARRRVPRADRRRRRGPQTMTASMPPRIRAVVRKELRDYRRKRSIVVTMAILPIIFLIKPVLAIFLTSASNSVSSLQDRQHFPPLLALIPVIMPSTLAAYSVVGEREQGTLEPLLTTPIRSQEFILGKAAAVMIPTVGCPTRCSGSSSLPFGCSPTRGRVGRVPPGPGTARPRSLRAAVGGLGHRGRNGDLCPGERSPRRPAAGDAGEPSAPRRGRACWRPA